MPLLDYYEVTTQPDARFSLIWLHGLGADGYDFSDVVPALNLPAEAGIRFIFPHAPEIPVTANGGYIMRAWYDILEFSAERRINSDHLRESVQMVWELIEQQHALGIPYENIILAGFSQGGAVAYQAALNFPHRLGGLLAMSTYIADTTLLDYQNANIGLPILIQHGSFDPVVIEEMGIRACQTLRQKGYRADYQTYPAEHHLCPQQISRISEWLQDICI